MTVMLFPEITPLAGGLAKLNERIDLSPGAASAWRTKPGANPASKDTNKSMEIIRAVSFRWFEFMTFSLQGPFFRIDALLSGKITQLEKQERQKQPFGIHL
jgi:hypothetical protein